MDSITGASCCLSKLLHCVELKFVGFRIRHCLDALERDFGIRCRNALDLGQLPRTLRRCQWSLEGYTLVDIANKVNNMGFSVINARSICNAATFSDWGATTLSQKQIEAATMRAYLCFFASNCLYGGYFIDQDY
ncbi:Cytospin-A [Bienertia sinuspersici]